ncbi:nuclear transport factor 2 family protein [Paraburkholderia unamae]|uniref:SnoaL-like domain-containing protein n=1 Tax=Paraburkholderia unamae TaxID=219649 RepID=A0ABX5K8V1_9BURK|nr:nuclear transport factor 2 family protein [Paraburkholderia unamae]PVX70891.1 hypothetical protein C7402_13345 [Paraburkholderia unamae]
MNNLLDPVKRQFDAYNARNLEHFLLNFSEDFRGYRAHEPQPTIVGKATLAEFYRTHRFSIPELHAELISRTVMGNKVFDFEKISGLSEKPIEMAAVFEVRGGLIVASWAFPAE